MKNIYEFGTDEYFKEFEKTFERIHATVEKTDKTMARINILAERLGK